MLDSERLWNAAYGCVALVMGTLWFAGTLKTDPGLGQGWARDIGNILAFYWMPTALGAGGIWTILWNLSRLTRPSQDSEARVPK